MYGWIKIFGPWQLVRQLGRFMDEQGQVLGANPVDFPLVLDLQQGDLVVVAFTVKACSLVGCHNNLSIGCDKF